MLVLSRKPEQSLLIGDDIVVTVTEVLSNGRVRIGIAAPREVTVLRPEMLGMDPTCDLSKREIDVATEAAKAA